MKKIIALGFIGMALIAGSQNTFNLGMFGVLEARQFGPGTMSGRITSIEGVNKDEGKTLYVGTAI